MTLCEGKVGEVFQVTGLSVGGSVTRRLQALGINEGTKIEILNRKKNGAIIIKIRGTRWALGRPIALGIRIEEAGK